MDKYDDSVKKSHKTDNDTLDISLGIPISPNKYETKKSKIDDPICFESDPDNKEGSKLERRETFSFTNKVTLHFGPNQTTEEYNNQIRQYGNNSVSTTKYSIFTWFPKSLFMQFRRIANIYFLIISILTLMPFSPKNPYTQTATFILVLVFTMIKEAYEDIKRYNQDKEINNKSAYIYDHKTDVFIKRRWKDILVGDLIKVKMS